MNLKSKSQQKKIYISSHKGRFDQDTGHCAQGKLKE